MRADYTSKFTEHIDDNEPGSPGSTTTTSSSIPSEPYRISRKPLPEPHDSLSVANIKRARANTHAGPNTHPTTSHEYRPTRSLDTNDHTMNAHHLTIDTRFRNDTLNISSLDVSSYRNAANGPFSQSTHDLYADKRINPLQHPDWVEDSVGPFEQGSSLHVWDEFRGRSSRRRLGSLGKVIDAVETVTRRFGEKVGLGQEETADAEVRD